MSWRLKSSALAVGAAALLSAQVAYASPAASRTYVDPLVAVSALGSAQSNAAVCAGSTAAAGAAATAAAQGAAGCLLPVTSPPPVAAAQAAPPPAVPVRTARPFGSTGILLGLAGVAALIALIVALSDNGSGDETPISPA